jgi:hypothetical protein
LGRSKIWEVREVENFYESGRSANMGVWGGGNIREVKVIRKFGKSGGLEGMGGRRNRRILSTLIDVFL